MGTLGQPSRVDKLEPRLPPRVCQYGQPRLRGGSADLDGFGEFREHVTEAAGPPKPGTHPASSARGWAAAAAAWWVDDRRWWHALVALLYVAAALLFTYPLWLAAGTHIAYKPSGDQLFLLSILEWNRTALFSKPGEFFAGNFYYGSGGALFGSDLLLGFLPIYGPMALITQSPVLAYSITHIAAWALNAGAMYATVLVLTRSRSGALVAGAVYAFGPLQLAYANHFQLLGAWYLPLVLLFGIRLWRGGGWLDFGLATLMVWTQFATAVHLGVIAAMVYAAFVIPPAAHQVVRGRDLRLALAMLAAGVVASLPFVPIVHGYLGFSEAWRAERDITEVHGGSVQLRDYLSPTGRLRWYDALMERFPVPTGERRVFPGFVPPLLAAIGAGAGLLGLTDRRRELRTVGLVLLALVAVAVLFSLGTHWKGHEVVSEHELPYLLLFEHVPVFRAIRVVARFSLLAHFAMAALAGIGVYAITRRWPRHWLAAPLVGLLAAGTVLVEALPRPLATFEIPTDAPLRAVLRNSVTGPMLLVPVSGKDEVWRMWMVTETGAGPIVNGYSGHIWQQYWYFRDMTQSLMAGEMDGLAAGLQAYGIRTIAVDSAQFGGRDRELWESFAGGPWVTSSDMAGDHLLITLAEPEGQPANRWANLDTTLLVDKAEPDAGFVGTLVMRNPGTSAWIPPGDSRVRRVRIQWIRADGADEIAYETPMLPPPFLRPGQVHAVPMHGFTPPMPGSYLLRASADGERLFERRVRIESVERAAFEGSVDGMLASLALRTSASFTTTPSDLLPLHVDALNIGRKSWSEEANIRLGWRWRKVEQDGSETEQPTYEGRVVLLGHLYNDIPPGLGYAFAGNLRAPDEPGRYVVRVSMLIELVAWFNIDPIEIEVIVKPRDA